MSEEEAVVVPFGSVEHLSLLPQSGSRLGASNPSRQPQMGAKRPFSQEKAGAAFIVEDVLVWGAMPGLPDRRSDCRGGASSG